jgi:hypothetical protein
MPLQRRDGPDGPYWVRPAYRPEDYRVASSSLRAIENWRGDLSVDMLLEERDGPFEGWDELKRFDRDGKRWVRLCHATGEYCVDVEVTSRGLGEVVPVDPLVAYNLAVAADRTRNGRVVPE